MKKKKEWNIKIKRLFEEAGYPVYLHRYGPKKFESWILIFGLIIKEKLRLSYRETADFLTEYHDYEIHFTTLQKAKSRIPYTIWTDLLAATHAEDETEITAVDGTTYSMSSPSHHYLKRIDRNTPVGVPIQLISYVDVTKRKFLSAKVNSKWEHEAKFVPYLHEMSMKYPFFVLMDKGFDAEYLHQYFKEDGIRSIAPVRKGCVHGRNRKFLRDCFDWSLYHQRSIVESMFSALKRRYGHSVSSRKFTNQVADLYCKMITYNVFVRIMRLFLQSRAL